MIALVITLANMGSKAAMGKLNDFRKSESISKQIYSGIVNMLTIEVLNSGIVPVLLIIDDYDTAFNELFKVGGYIDQVV